MSHSTPLGFNYECTSIDASTSPLLVSSTAVNEQKH